MAWLFGLLGPLEVRYEGVAVPMESGRQRALLASLLADANRTVSAGELCRRVWGTRCPADSRACLQLYVSRLRRALARAGGPGPIATRPGGYLIEIDGEALDVTRFRRLAAGARRVLAEDPERARRWLGEALALWRGDALTGVPSDVLHREEAVVLAEERLGAVEMRIEACLSLGWQRDLVPELADLTARYPLRERFWAQRMLALYRCGRASEALACYRELGSHLAGQLGTDPTPALHDLHQAILTSDPALTAPPARPAAGGRSVPPPAEPRQLPAGMTGFAGRASELKLLSELASEATGNAGAAVILAIEGMAGIGKTALAVHWAHQMTGQFPGGQLYANLRGFDPSGTPAVPAEVIRVFLQGLGVHPERIPAGMDAQAGLYRTLLTGRRAMIVLDNARDADQVRPLLPGSPGCMVVITSRSQLTPLAAGHGAHLIRLEVLTAGEAASLLSARLGTARVTAEPHAAAELVNLCGQLPLALSIAAARAAARPALPLAVCAAELRDARQRLDAFDAGDQASNLRAVFSWSCQGLTSRARALFRLLGAHSRPDISLPAAASLAGITLADAATAMRELAAVHLVTEHGPGRFTLHSLLRAYAAEQAPAVSGISPSAGSRAGSVRAGARGWPWWAAGSTS